MRLLIKFKPEQNIPYNEISKFHIQGFIYNLLKDEMIFRNIHERGGFKFFNFSNIFPIGDYTIDKSKNLIISSPRSSLIEYLYIRLVNMDKILLNKYNMVVDNVKLIKGNKFHNNTLITATPIVVYQDNNCYSLRDNNNLNYFFNRIRDNITKKYNAYYHTDLELTEDLFNDFELNREVVIPLSHGPNNFNIIGSIWKFKFNDEIKHNPKLLNFIYDTGLGEKNSLGFGFLNFIK